MSSNPMQLVTHELLHSQYVTTLFNIFEAVRRQQKRRATRYYQCFFHLSAEDVSNSTTKTDTKKWVASILARINIFMKLQCSTIWKSGSPILIHTGIGRPHGLPHTSSALELPVALPRARRIHSSYTG